MQWLHSWERGTIADASHEDLASQVEWGGDFDPERFDRKAVNTALWWWAKARGRHRKFRPDLSDC